MVTDYFGLVRVVGVEAGFCNLGGTDLVVHSFFWDADVQKFGLVFQHVLFVEAIEPGGLELVELDVDGF